MSNLDALQVEVRRIEDPREYQNTVFVENGFVPEKQPEPSGSSFSTDKILSWTSLAAGAVHGYFDAVGTPLPGNYTESLLTWGPAVAGAMRSGIDLAAVGAKAAEGREGVNPRAKALVLGTAGAIGGATRRGLETLIGYGAGYVSGVVARQFY